MDRNNFQPFQDFLNSVKSIDLYINYSCGLRCNHCFVGDLLNTNMEMPLSMVKSIVEQCIIHNVKNITLLGGEPTLHKNIIEIINLFVNNGINTRIVTNGQKSYQSLHTKLPKEIKQKIHVCFSIDGSNSDTHDFIRGKGVFAKLYQSIALAKLDKISMSAITSISKDNFDDLIHIIEFCDLENMKYINIHYVTDRGFAQKGKLVEIQDWKQVCQTVKSLKSNIKIRIENTFVPIANKVECEVVKKENLIIDPNGHIYGCTMFMNLPNSFSGSWKEDGIEINLTSPSENNICSCSSEGCPAMKIVNSDLVNCSIKLNNKIDCIFNKTEYSIDQETV